MIFLETNRLHLRNVMSSDVDIMFDYRNNEICARFQRGQTKTLEGINDLVLRRQEDTISTENPFMLAVALKDTVKVVRDDGTVEQTPDRARLRAVQTPQVFQADLLKAALQTAIEQNLPITDDCSAVELLGKVVFLVDGEEENLKITTPVDLLYAEVILRSREERV